MRADQEKFVKVVFQALKPLGSRLDIRHNGFRLFDLIAQRPVTLLPLLHSDDRFTDCRVGHAGKPRLLSA